jgi:hypothetical protein
MLSHSITSHKIGAKSLALLDTRQPHLWKVNAHTRQGYGGFGWVWVIALSALCSLLDVRDRTRPQGHRNVVAEGFKQSHLRHMVGDMGTHSVTRVLQECYEDVTSVLR